MSKTKAVIPISGLNYLNYWNSKKLSLTLCELRWGDGKYHYYLFILIFVLR